MFLTAGVRLVASVCVALGVGNAIFMMMFLLTIPEPDVQRDTYLTHAILASQVGLVAVGLGLFRMNRLAWIGFWLVGLIAVGLAEEQARWLMDQRGEAGSIPFFVAVGLVLWFISSGICLLLPSSRKFFFDEPDQVWMHKKVFRDHAEHVTDISGRPRKPMGISLMAWTTIVIAIGIFIQAMNNLAEQDTVDNAHHISTETIAAMIACALALIVFSVGLFRTKVWGWLGMLVCAIATVAIAAKLVDWGTKENPPMKLEISLSWFLLCAVWCGTAIVYLLLPTVRRPFFSRRRTRSAH